jgi:predicted RNase H-like HicB family nuclease
MDRIVRLHIELQPEGTYLGASADMPGLVARGRTVSETLDSADTIIRNLIAGAGFTFDPLVVLA